MRDEFYRRAVRVAFAETSEDVKRWVSRKLLEQRFAAETRRFCEWLTDDDRARFFHAAIKSPGTTWRDYRMTLLSAELGRAVIGIRFRSGRTDDAFVQVYARDFTIDTLTQLNCFVWGCLEAYTAFSPWAVRLRIPPDVQLVKTVGEVTDFITVAGHLSELRLRPLLVNLFVRLARTANFFNAYRAEYANLHAEHPEFVGVVEPLDEDEINEAVLCGEAYEIWVDDTWAGLLIARPAYQDGMRGYVLAEELLTAPFRGRRLAAYAQRGLIELLDDPRRAILFGSISPINRASLATALRVGRRPVSRCTFLNTLPGKAAFRAV
jgi:hypothetical protein